MSVTTIADPVLNDAVLTIADCDAVYEKIAEAKITADELRVEWQRFKRDRDAIIQVLQGMKKAEILKHCGMFVRSSEKKDSLVKSAINQISNDFYPWSMSWSPFTETHDEAIERNLKAVTDAKIQEYAAIKKAQKAEYLQSLSDPQTLDQFRTFISLRGSADLDEEQVIRYDRLLAEAGRERRQWQTKIERERELEKRSTAAPVELDNATLSYQKTVHTRDGYDLWVVQLSDRVDRAKFTELRDRAKALGGWYSKYRGNGAIAGFQFKEEQSAIDFCNVEETVKRDVELVEDDSAEVRREKAIEHLSQLAGGLIVDSRSRIQQERRINTHRRMSIASGCIQDAMKDFALAQTIRKVAGALQAREAVFCDRFRYAVEFQDFNLYLYRAQYARRKAEDIRYRELGSISIEDVKYAEYPYPSISSGMIKQLVAFAKGIPGCKKDAAAIEKYCKSKLDKDVCITFQHDFAIELLRSLHTKLKRNWRAPYVVERVGEQLLRLDRMKRMDIHDAPTFRTALREYLELRGDAATIEVDPNAAAKRKGQLACMLRIPDFFPTPKLLRDRVYELAQLTPGCRVLEPGAGRGDFADELRELGHDVSVCEISSYLREILEAKQHNIVATDFLEFIPVQKYDRIIANFPFTHNADIDHCYKAFNCLALDGRMVAIVGAGSIENGRAEDEDSIPQDKLNKFQKFRRWLDEVGAGLIKLEPGSFKDSDRSTGVNCYYVIIDN